MAILKKMAALVLAALMLTALVIPASAAGTSTGKIVITPPTLGHTGGSDVDVKYDIYRPLTIESDATTTVYNIETGWEGFFEADTTNFTVVERAGKKQLVYHGELDGKTLAEDLLAYAATNSIAPVTTATATYTNGQAADITIDNMPLGIYLVQSDAGALLTLDKSVVENGVPVAKLIDKNSLPGVVKNVQEDSTVTGTAGAPDGTWGTSDHADINQDIYFKVEVTIRGGAHDYKIVDVMDPGLNYIGIDAVYTVKSGVQAPLTNSYTENHVQIEGTTGTQWQSTITFDNALTDTMADSDKLIVVYKAKLDPSVVVNKAYWNHADLYFKLGNNAQDVHKLHAGDTESWTYGFEIFKFERATAGTTAEAALEGVKFSLTRSGDNALMTFTKGTDGAYYPAAGGSTELVTDANGKIVFKGLDADTYILKETEPKAGFTPLDSDYKITITAAENYKGAATVTAEKVKEPGVNVALDNGILKIENTRGNVLPTTGGMGTTLFYAVGGLLVLFSAVMLITKKRMTK